METHPLHTLWAKSEGRTYVPWWALALSIPLVLLTVLLSFAGIGSVMGMGGLVLAAFVSEITGAWLITLVPVLMVGIVVAFACAALCAYSADQLLNPGRWRFRHLRSGRCPWCRYDIRGLAEERCPECGKSWLRTSPFVSLTD